MFKITPNLTLINITKYVPTQRNKKDLAEYSQGHGRRLLTAHNLEPKELNHQKLTSYAWLREKLIKIFGCGVSHKNYSNHPCTIIVKRDVWC